MKTTVPLWANVNCGIDLLTAHIEIAYNKLTRLWNSNHILPSKHTLSTKHVFYYLKNSSIQQCNIIINIDEKKTVRILISWLQQKPDDLDLHCFQKEGIKEF